MLVPNRYIDEPLVVYNDTEGSTITKGFRDTFPEPSNREKYTLYTVQENDTLQLIAVKAYNYPELWFLISDFNPEVTFNDQLYTGLVIKLPSQVVASRYLEF